MKLETIKKKLESLSIKTEYKQYIDASGTQKTILCAHHNYEGIYPTAEARKKMQHIHKICTKGKNKYEHRGHYTATFIF